MLKIAISTKRAWSIFKKLSASGRWIAGLRTWIQSPFAFWWDFMALSLTYGNASNYALRKLVMKTRDAACLKVFCINAVPFNFGWCQRLIMQSKSKYNAGMSSASFSPVDKYPCCNRYAHLCPTVCCSIVQSFYYLGW